MIDGRAVPPRFPGGDYIIEGVLGSGGMAVVYRARDVRRQRSVAIKVLRPELGMLTGNERFRREMAVAASFAHPHIVPLLDLGEAEDAHGRSVPFYVMPIIEGETLRDRLAREGPLRLPDALRYAREVLEALQYAHQQGVVHRDIKPANVLLTGGHALVTDFGVARPLPGAGGLHEAEEELTQSGLTVGTPAYMSPEQALGDKFVDARSDLYSLGCVLYEMLVGAQPFAADSAASIISRKLAGRYGAVQAVRADVPPALERVIATALAPEASQRFASAGAFLEALAAFESGAQVPTFTGAPAATRDGGRQGSGPSWTLPGGTGGSATATFAGGARRTSLVALGAMVCIVLATAWFARGERARTALLPRDEDAARLAVLPLVAATGDSASRVVAEGLSVDLIDELARYPALTVISRNGVLPYAGQTVPTDSIARALGVGSIVTGDVQQRGDSLTVTVRLIDARTNAQRGRVTASGVGRDLIAVRTTILDSVTGFLRRRLGEQLGERSSQGAAVAEAWELLARVRTMGDGELRRAASMAPRAREARFVLADSLLQRAAALDPAWPAPLVLSGRLLLLRAGIEEVARQTVADLPRGPGFDATALRWLALERGTQARARNPDDADARYLRGKALLDLWRTAKPDAPDSLRGAAEAELRAVTTQRRDMAEAWTDLSMLLQMTGNYESSRRAAESALTADAFLRSMETVVGRLHFTSLASGRLDEARRWCAFGQERFPIDPRFWGCELTNLGWTGASAEDVQTAWRLLAEAETRDANNILAVAWGTRRLLVAAIAARAGLPDSARAIVARVRARGPAAGPADQIDYGEAHVLTILGERDRAIPLLARYLQANPALRGQVRFSPWFAPLRDEPRFLAITAP
jgi:serine/threonine-protein kinase